MEVAKVSKAEFEYFWFSNKVAWRRNLKTNRREIKTSEGWVTINQDELEVDMGRKKFEVGGRVCVINKDFLDDERWVREASGMVVAVEELGILAYFEEIKDIKYFLFEDVEPIDHKLSIEELIEVLDEYCHNKEGLANFSCPDYCDMNKLLGGGECNSSTVYALVNRDEIMYILNSFKTQKEVGRKEFEKDKFLKIEMKVGEKQYIGFVDVESLPSKFELVEQC